MANGKDDFSPMMRKYLETKEEYKDCLLLYRLGDFYELFFEDAKIASKVLDIALTGRACGLKERAPMCGVPYHAVDSYVAKLIEKGYKVAICDQLTEPTPGKIVERAVTRVITSGTAIESEILKADKNNYILSLCKKFDKLGIAYCDVSTGEFKISEFDGDLLQNLIEILSRLRPAEIICDSLSFDMSLDKSVKALDFLPVFTKQTEFSFDYEDAKDKINKQFGISSIKGHDFAKLNAAICATGALLEYLLSTQKRSLNHINRLITERKTDYMLIDYRACRDLELIMNARDGRRKGSLFGLINLTKTAMGSRLLEKWILQPLQSDKEINKRLDCVEELFYNPMLLSEIMQTLSTIGDIARVCSKISFNTITPRECVGLKNSLKNVIDLSQLCKELKQEKFLSLFSHIDKAYEISNLLDSAIEEDPPAITSEGGYIKESYNEELGEIKNMKKEASKWLSNLESKEREETNIKSLRIGYSRVFGYFIEVNKSQSDLVPSRYERRQTISNHERFTIPELKSIEEKLLNAEESSIKLESSIYKEIQSYLQENVGIVQELAQEVAFVDVICSLSKVAQEYKYVRPKVVSGYRHIKIEDGRHPIVETSLRDEAFVPNDAFMNESTDRTLIITGPNMAGKSTYMRQIALIVILAHIGSFVPASYAEMGIVDRIFTRIGANDDISSGQSTFMVEMIEVANILNNATSKSLVLLDEVGRGTATYDGMSIAWAVLEYISTHIRCKTLFSTHYHEITSLEGVLDGVKNYRVTVKEFNDSIVFLRKVVRGSTDKSFGIEVAGLCGIYKEIINRAKSILRQLEKNAIKFDIKSDMSKSKTLSQIQKDNIINEIRNIDIDKLSPMEAFELLIDLNKKVKM